MDEETVDLTNDAPDDGGRPDNRIRDLSGKVKTASDERDAAKAEADAAKKEVEFYKGFTPLTSKYQGAAEYQDKILEKVRAGYELEDATISVMAKAGKLNSEPAPELVKDKPAGGSASVSVTVTDKALSDMTRDEKRAELEAIERESGAVTQMLRKGI